MQKSISEVRSTNRVIALLYGTVALVLLISYAIEMANGTRSVPYFITFTLILLIPGAINTYVQKKNPYNENTRLILATGYLVMYIFVMFTTFTAMTFSYIVPLIVIFMLTHDFKKMLFLNCSAVVINIAQVIYSLVFLNKGEDAEYIVDVEIQLALIIILAVFSIIAANCDVRINKVKMDAIEEQSEKNRTMLEEVLSVTAQMDTSIGVIDENVEILYDSCEKSVFAMKEVCEGTTTTAENIQAQIEKTGEIQSDIETISALSTAFNALSTETGKITNTGMGYINQLMNSVTTNSNSMSDTLNNLSELKQKVESITSFLEIISGISSSTKLLALNASIEAARAGEHGLGFAVVASEIGKLAESTAASISETQGIVDTITEHTNAVSDSINVLMKGFEEQNKTISMTNETFSEIYGKVTTIGEQTDSLEQKINILRASNVVIVDSIQNISAISEETMANSSQTEEMSDKAMELANKIKEMTSRLTVLAEQLDGVSKRA